MIKLLSRIFGLLSIATLAACSWGPDIKRISGQTMGTTYNVTAINGSLNEAELSELVEAALAKVNAQMSNWDPNSEISKFNASQATDPQEISPELRDLMMAANEIHDQSEGKFDVTLGPLIELWGFGARKPSDALPTSGEILEALSKVGQTSRLTLDTQASTLTKAAPEVEVALAAIGKGYGVDAVANALRDAKIERFMVEIGGDLVTSGLNEQGAPWKIAIEKPGAGAQTIELIVPVTDMGMATSGDYRNFIIENGVRYSHIIDPVTGKPITHNTTSVTVLAEDAMRADGWATAMLALGAERGLQVAERIGLAVYFIQRGQASHITSSSTAFDKLLSED